MDPATCLRCLPHLSMVPAANSAVWNSLSLCPPEKVILQTSTEGSCPTMQVLRPRRVSQSLSCPTLSWPCIHCPRWRTTFYLCPYPWHPVRSLTRGQGSWPALLELGTGVTFPRRELCS